MEEVWILPGTTHYNYIIEKLYLQMKPLCILANQLQKAMAFYEFTRTKVKTFCLTHYHRHRKLSPANNPVQEDFSFNVLSILR